MRYVELRTHSAFSFGDGATTPEALVRRAAEYGYPALGLTDHADLGGVIRFALECERSGLHPVVGAELVVDGHPAALLALDERGYRNLAALVTRSRVGALRVERGAGAEAVRPRGRPSLSFAELEARSEGLFVLTGPASGEVASLVRRGGRKRLRTCWTGGGACSRAGSRSRCSSTTCRARRRRWRLR